MLGMAIMSLPEQGCVEMKDADTASSCRMEGGFMASHGQKLDTMLLCFWQLHSDAEENSKQRTSIVACCCCCHLWRLLFLFAEVAINGAMVVAVEAMGSSGGPALTALAALHRDACPHSCCLQEQKQMQFGQKQLKHVH